MRTFSRWMPASPQRAMRRRDWLVVTVLVGLLVTGLCHLLSRHPWGWLLLLGFVAAVAEGMRSDDRHLRRLADNRSGEDIGSFARALDRRHQPFDPWVVRAVWDALQAELIVDGKPVPIRPTDCIVEDLRLDWEDLDFDIVETIAPRARCSLQDIERNPLYGRVVTVGDLVHLLSSQPRRGE